MSDAPGTPEGDLWYQKNRAARVRIHELEEENKKLHDQVKAFKDANDVRICTCGRPLRDTGAGITCQEKGK